MNRISDVGELSASTCQREEGSGDGIKLIHTYVDLCSAWREGEEFSILQLLPHKVAGEIVHPGKKDRGQWWQIWEASPS